MSSRVSDAGTPNDREGILAEIIDNLHPPGDKYIR